MHVFKSELWLLAGALTLASLCSQAQTPRQGRNVANFPALKLTEVASGFSSPLLVTHAGDGTNRLFVVEQGGVIKIVQNGSVLGTLFLDISSKISSGGEKGLLGLAFHPDYETAHAAGKGKFYVYYSRSGGSSDHQSVVAEYQVSADANVAQAGSERILLTFDQPQSNHNGGDIAFGPDDKMLYIATGDGGSSNDSGTGHTANTGNAQDKSNLLGKILRIDVNGNNGSGGQYGIPSDNPFVGQGGGVKEELFALGFRNPYRFSFDDGALGTQSRDRLFVGDVGQNAREEVDLVQSGGNYGWRIREGDIATPGVSTPTDPGGLIEPIAAYNNPDTGRSVIGGHIYRGSAIPQLAGKYIFADFFNAKLFGLEEGSGSTFTFCLLTSTPDVSGISDIGVDENNEIFVTQLGGGKLFKLASAAAPTITSALTATATVNQAFQYTITASGAATITFTTSTLPAGLSLNGAEISGTPTQAGDVSITITATNDNGQDQKTLVLSIGESGGGGGGSSTDTDGDGFSDAFETGAGSDPDDAQSTPNNNQPAGTPVDLTLAHLQIRLNFSDPGKDLIKLRGTLPIPAGLDPSTLETIVFIGGITKTLQLDKNGKAQEGHDLFKIQIRRKNGEVRENAEAQFMARFLKGDFTSDLDSSGLTNTTIRKPGNPVGVEVQVLFNGILYTQEVTLTYTAKENRNGTGTGP